MKTIADWLMTVEPRNRVQALHDRGEHFEILIYEDEVESFSKSGSTWQEWAKGARFSDGSVCYCTWTQEHGFKFEPYDGKHKFAE